MCGVSIILGNNGYIWISPIVMDDHQHEQMRFQLDTATSSIDTHTHVSHIQ